ncbi:MAG: SprT family protein [Ectobacillus sp.]
MVNGTELQRLVEQVSLESFKKPFRHKALFNRRLRTTGGRYLLKNHNIELNEHYYETFGKEALIDIIKHELCHYHLHLEGKGYKHRDKDFRTLLKQVNAPRFCKAIPGARKKKSQVQYIYKCTGCFYEYTRKRKMDVNCYVCGRCRGELMEVKKRLDT